MAGIKLDKVFYFFVVICLFIALATPKKEKKLETLTIVIDASVLPIKADPMNCSGFLYKIACPLIHLKMFSENKNQITSELFSSFSYNKSSKTIFFTLKPALKFSDETPIGTKDVVMAIKRAIIDSPDFPVLRNILGVKKFVNERKSLEDSIDGISTEGDTIKIHLDQDVPNPIYRFSARMFSIVPAHVIDTNSAQITKKDFPNSGAYVEEKVTQSSITYKLREGFQNLPKKIILDLPTIRNENIYNSAIKTNGVVITGGLTFAAQSRHIDQSKFSIKKASSARSLGFYFPTQHQDDFFKKQVNRLTFAQHIRKYFLENFNEFEVKKSLSYMPKLVPGYLSDEEFGQLAPPKTYKPPSDNYTLKWHYGEGSVNALFTPAIKYAADNMGLKLEEVTGPDVNDGSQWGEPLDIYLTDFSAQDPVGDILGWFSEKSCPKDLKSLCSNDKVKAILNRVFTDQQNSKKELEELNRTIFEDANKIPLIHNEWVYAVPKDAPYELVDLPQAINSPAPWQIVKMKD